MRVVDYLIKNENLIFNILFLFVWLFFLSMNPFLKYPFDMYHHLVWIDNFYHNLNKIPTDGRFYWHYFWGHIFNLFQIDNRNFFLRAYIIHYTNITISFLSVYIFSKTIYKYLLINENNLVIKYLSLLAVIIWFIIYATFSVGYHMVWIQWYSINYQITLPLILFASSIIINLFFSNLCFLIKILYLILLSIILFIVLTIHSMEFIYFLMYLFVIGLIYIDKIYLFFKKHLIFLSIFLVLVSVLLYNLLDILHLVTYTEPKLVTYIYNGNFVEMVEQIMRDGNSLVLKYNRAFASMNELIYLSLVLIPILIIVVLKKFKYIINIRFFIFIIITSLFVLIPIFKVSAGIASLLTYMAIVNRFYYSSIIYLIVPMFAYFIVKILNIKQVSLFLYLISFFILISTFYYSRFAIVTNQSFYKNIQSIKNSLNERKVGFNLSKKNINKIGILIKKYKQNNSNKPYFFAREDIAFVLKYIYNENVYIPIKWKGKRLTKDFYIKAYSKDNNHTNKVLFKVPKGFPNYEPYK